MSEAPIRDGAIGSIATGAGRGEVPGRPADLPLSLAVTAPARRAPIASPEYVAGPAGRLEGPRIRLFTPSARWGGRGRRELLLTAAIAAILAHLAVFGAVVEAPRLLPHPAHPAPPPPPPEAQIVMVKENTPTVGGTPPVPPKPTTHPQPLPPKAGGGAPQTLDAPHGVAVARSDETSPASQAGDRQGRGHAPQAKTPPKPDGSPVRVNLDIDGDPGWGLADQRTIPASPDDRYINKPAGYPRGAAARGEEGVVYLRTLVAPDGHAEAVEIEQSSGYADLDNAARSAVAKWHFRPAVRGGQPVESEMHEAYHFSLIR